MDNETTEPIETTQPNEINETSEPVLTQLELDTIIENIIIMNENLELINEKQQDIDLISEQMLSITENLDLINKKIEGEFDAEGNLLVTPAEETELFTLQEIHSETIAQNAVLSELYTSSINQEPYRYDIAEQTNGHLLTLSEQIEIMNSSIEESAEINYMSQASIVTYATVFLPLTAIILMLWWFFKNFLNRIR